MVIGLAAAGTWGSPQRAESSGPEKQVAELKQQVDSLQARVKALEQRLGTLEAMKLSRVQVVPAPKPTPPPVAPPMTLVPRLEPAPEHWQEWNFNGLKYYLIPLRQ